MIELRNVSKIYRTGAVEYEALRGVNLGIKEGEFVAIMGPSGSGKSTLMHILGALDSPTGGTYFLGGKDVSSLTDDELASIRNSRIGFVFQTFNLFPRATVLRNVMLPLAYAGVPEEMREVRVRAALAAVNIDEEHYAHRSNELSGGQIQRVAIARALVNDPAIILADEPTGNLDSTTGKIVLETFRKLNREGGRTVILITHEQEVAGYADRIVYIRDGQIVEAS
jgi:putative ABC transport system ATP-binding protein